LSGFPVFGFHTQLSLQSKVISLAFNPQPGGPGLCIYVPKWQGDPVTLQCTGVRFHCLLDFIGLHKRYLNPPPYWNLGITKTYTIIKIYILKDIHNLWKWLKYIIFKYISWIPVIHITVQ
jgi:hypothetical protein